MYFAATDLLTDSCSGGISIFEDGVQVGPVPGNNVLGGDSPPLQYRFPHRKRYCNGGGVSGVVTVSQLMQPCDSK